MELSNTVWKTHDNHGREIYYNTITKKSLPVGSSEEKLKEGLFLSNQKLDAIKKRLFKFNKYCHFTIIPTWECNLRCTHCTVLKKLIKKDVVKVDVPKTVDFITRFADAKATKIIRIAFVGGEPLLAIDCLNGVIDSLKLLKYDLGTSVTTNLVSDLNEKVLDCLRKMNIITVSLDGDHYEHNIQRKSFTGDVDDPFLKTVTNLKTLIKEGMTDSLYVQCALRDEFLNSDHKERYYRLLLKLGIHGSRIRFGCLHPTERLNAGEGYMSVLSKGSVISDVCCRYRQSNFTIDKNDIYTDFYSWGKVGTLDDNIDTIIENSNNQALKVMPVLQDEKCMSCPVIGFCWGGCSNGLKFAETPSKFCNQSKLIENITKAAKEKTLINL